MGVEIALAAEYLLDALVTPAKAAVTAGTDWMSCRLVDIACS
jgi:hypothetical protein